MNNLNSFFLGCLLFSASLSMANADERTDAFQRVKNSVVSIEAQQKGLAVSSGTLKDRLMRGSGVFISDRSQIVTAADLVQTADWIEVTFMKNKTISGRVQSSTMRVGIATLDLEVLPTDVAGAKMGDSDKVQIGERVFVVQVSSGMEPKMIAGRVTRRRKSGMMMENFLPSDFLQTNLALTRHDDGTALFNANGEVIGIISNTLSSAAGLPGMNFAIPSNLLVELLLKEPFFWSGVSGCMLSGSLARSFQLPQEKGFLVEKISDDSPFVKLGLHAGTKGGKVNGESLILGGDVVLAVDDISLAKENAANEIRDHLKTVAKNSHVKLKIFRDGKTQELATTLQD